MAVIKRRKWTNASGEHVAWQLDFTDRFGKRHREQFALKRDAETRLGELQGTTRAGTYRPLADRADVAEACKEFCKYMEGRRDRGEKVTETYLRSIRQYCENYVDPAGDYVVRRPGTKKKDSVGFKGGIGAIKLADLTAARVVKFRDDMRDHGAGIVTTRRVLGTLSRILKHAVEKDMAVLNVAKGIRVTGTRDEDSEKVTPPSKADLAAILKAADPDFKIRVQFAAASGLRASEQWALRWKNVDLETGKVTVDSRVDAFGGIDTTKSKAGKRTVPIGKSMVDALAAWRERSKYKKDGDFVFPDGRGNFTRHTNMTKRFWNPLIKVAGIYPIGWHALRHFAVSTWIEAGLQPKAVQTLAGHASYAITMNRYGHLFPSEDHKAAFDKIAETLA
ncbi:site-specific integrase [Sinorhizobium meliloti]|uniref:tyrosine-type recombinase/integrase n=1 Tax=Rhizobium meliloti TaxID=382 RepID=UPI00209530A3|nr:site-specific integrase [Sinorhizobium meliloti]MCO6423819.1 site-specific integrase [Sinorhizobium meliloti]